MMEAKCQEMGVMHHEILKLVTNEQILLGQLPVCARQYVATESPSLPNSVMMPTQTSAMGVMMTVTLMLVGNAAIQADQLQASDLLNAEMAY